MELDFNKVGTVDENLTFQITSSMIPSINKKQTIYHYTSINGIKSILDKKKLWFTNIDYMNDKHEVIEGLKQFEKAGKKLYGDGYDKHCKKIISKLKKQKNKVFVCCFSLDRDELSMWNYYTKDINNQGYNIGFDYKNLIISLLKNNKELHGCGLSFGNVDYCLSEKTYAHKAYDMVTESLKAIFASLACWLKGEKRSQAEMPESDVPYVKYFGEEPCFRRAPSFDTVYFMKKPCFSKENEFRIAIKATDEALEKIKNANKYKFRESNGILIPYVELEFSVADIIGITFSPTTKVDLSMRSMEDYCCYNGINPKELKEGIKKSKIPVRF